MAGAGVGAGLFQHVAWFLARALVLVHVLVGCLLWLLLKALVVVVERPRMVGSFATGGSP